MSCRWGEDWQGDRERLMTNCGHKLHLERAQERMREIEEDMPCWMTLYVDAKHHTSMMKVKKIITVFLEFVECVKNKPTNVSSYLKNVDLQITPVWMNQWINQRIGIVGYFTISCCCLLFD